MQTIFSTTATADQDAIEIIEQMIEVDGADAYETSEVRNGSGRVVGTEYELTTEQAEFLAATLAQVAQNEADQA